MNLTKEQIQHMVDMMTVEERKTWLQAQGYGAWLKASRRGTMEMATGTGKTGIGVRAAAETLEADPNALVYIVVPTETLRDVDWPNEMAARGHPGLEKKVKLICWASLQKEKPQRDVDLVILDEVHHLTPINANFFSRDEYKVFSVLGLTATLPGEYWDNDKEKMALIKYICPSVFEVPLEMAVDLKVVSDFQIYVLKMDLDNTTYDVPSGTKKKSFLTTELKHYQYLTKQLQRATYMKIEGLKFSWIQKRTQFLSNLKSKQRLAREVLDTIAKSGERTLIFCGSIEQSAQLCGDQVYNSSTTSAKLDDFRDGKLSYLGVVQALNEGKNLPNMDQILIVQLNSKELNLIQRIGRTIRWRENHVARIIILVAKGTADEKWYRSATENFDKSRIIEKHVTLSTQAVA
jgi:superfamily II DNA or RNA helicase